MKIKKTEILTVTVLVGGCDWWVFASQPNLHVWLFLASCSFTVSYMALVEIGGESL
jgi:hypothetical protein